MTEYASSSRTTYDVAILGTGIAGSMLGAILARNDAKVIVIGSDAHPRFTAGESATPYTLTALRAIAERYRVPELKTLATFGKSTKVIGPSFGIKKHVSFLTHHAGQPQDPRETNQFVAPGVMSPASHLFRQDSDAYLFYAAARYGCVTRQNFRVTELDFDASGVTVSGEDGEQYRARYLVDASGLHSPLARKLGLREDPCRFKHHSRSLRNHLLDVRPTDSILSHSAEDTPPVPWYQGTVHHVFERGCFWVIGFDNDKRSRNPACSVGLTVDPRRYPKDDAATPAEEFTAIAEEYPDITRQYSCARPLREWVSTERMQYSAKQVVGDRWCLLADSAGFVDGLFSCDLSSTADAVDALAWRLLRGIRDDDFSAQRFEYIERLQQKLLDYNDALVNAAFASFSDYDLWSAVFRIWAWGSTAGMLRRQQALASFLKDGREDNFRAQEEAPNLGLSWPDHDGYRKLFDEMVAKCTAFEAGLLTARQASDYLNRFLREADFVPKHFGFAEPGQRFLNPTLPTLARTLQWAHRDADPVVQRLIYSSVSGAFNHKLAG
jgi:tetracycline 7-halogenase / FADH2 O2-dependent halogenase